MDEIPISQVSPILASFFSVTLCTLLFVSSFNVNLCLKGVSHAQESGSRNWHQKVALNRMQLYSVQVSGTRNFQNTTDQTAQLRNCLVPETCMNLRHIFDTKNCQIFEHVSPPLFSQHKHVNFLPLSWLAEIWILRHSYWQKFEFIFLSAFKHCNSVWGCYDTECFMVHILNKPALSTTENQTEN